MASGYEVDPHRNILILGRTGVGKSTVGNKIGSETFDVLASALPCTTKPEYTTFNLRRQGTTYVVKVIDTVGLFDGKKDHKRVIVETKDYLQDKFREGISLVLFVMKQGRYDEAEKKSFNFIIDNLQKYVAEISALVITGCETLGKTKREDIVKEFKTLEDTKHVAKFMQKGIFTVGFPDLTVMDDDDPLRMGLQTKMEADTDALRGLVASAKKMKLSRELFDDKWWEIFYHDRLCSVM